MPVIKLAKRNKASWTDVKVAGTCQAAGTCDAPRAGIASYDNGNTARSPLVVAYLCEDCGRKWREGNGI